eukprot:323767-Amphidinium_carterae.1
MAELFRAEVVLIELRRSGGFDDRSMLPVWLTSSTSWASSLYLCPNTLRSGHAVAISFAYKALIVSRTSLPLCVPMSGGKEGVHRISSLVPGLHSDGLARLILAIAGSILAFSMALKTSPTCTSTSQVCTAQ